MEKTIKVGNVYKLKDIGNKTDFATIVDYDVTKNEFLVIWNSTNSVPVNFNEKYIKYWIEKGLWNLCTYELTPLWKKLEGYK